MVKIHPENYKKEKDNAFRRGFLSGALIFLGLGLLLGSIWL